VIGGRESCFGFRRRRRVAAKTPRHPLVIQKVSRTEETLPARARGETKKIKNAIFGVTTLKLLQYIAISSLTSESSRCSYEKVHSSGSDRKARELVHRE
jgi:hypothetical protein